MKSKYLKENIKKCVDYAMQQNDKTKRRIFTGLFEYTDRLVNDDIIVKALNDKEKQQWFNNEMIEEQKQEIERLNNIINELENKIYYLYNYAGLDTSNLDKELKELKEKK